MQIIIGFFTVLLSWSMLLQNPVIISELLTDDGTFPNNGKLPLMLYRNAIDISSSNPAGAVERIFQNNGWGNSWRDGIYPYHHYHSTAHEVLGVYSGSASVQLGGPNGPVFEVQAGDVIIIPAGVGHKNMGSSSDFRCVGAYPPGQAWDMNYGKPGERPRADQNISKVPLPNTDPVYGSTGPLIKSWGIR